MGDNTEITRESKGEVPLSQILSRARREKNKQSKCSKRSLHRRVVECTVGKYFSLLFLRFIKVYYFFDVGKVVIDMYIKIYNKSQLILLAQIKYVVWKVKSAEKVC